MVMFHSYVIEIVSFPIKNGDLVILTIVFCKRLPEANDVDFFVWDTEKNRVKECWQHISCSYPINIPIHYHIMLPNMKITRYEYSYW